MKLEEAKKLQNVFESNLNKISRGRYKSEEQKSVLENIILLYESREAVIKLINDYFSIASEGKYKTIHGKGISSMSAQVARGRVVKFSDRKGSDHANLKILTPKQMLQRLPIALVQVKKGNTPENLLNEIRKIIYLCIEQKKLLKKYIIT